MFFAYQRDGNNFGIMSQIVLQSTNRLEFGLTYVRFYDNLDTNTRSKLANKPFKEQSDRALTNSYGLEASIGI